MVINNSKFVMIDVECIGGVEYGVLFHFMVLKFQIFWFSSDICAVWCLFSLFWVFGLKYFFTNYEDMYRCRSLSHLQLSLQKNFFFTFLSFFYLLRCGICSSLVCMRKDVSCNQVSAMCWDWAPYNSECPCNDAWDLLCSTRSHLEKK